MSNLQEKIVQKLQHSFVYNSRGSLLVRGLEKEPYKEPGGSAGEQELRGDLLISELPERSLEPGGVGFCSPGTSARSRGNGLKLPRGG